MSACPPCQYPETCSPGRCRMEEDPQRFPARTKSAHIAAYTPGTGYKYYPPYINLKRSEDGKSVVVSLRANEKSPGVEGEYAVATFPIEEFATFLLDAGGHL